MLSLMLQNRQRGEMCHGKCSCSLRNSSGRRGTGKALLQEGSRLEDIRSSQDELLLRRDQAKGRRGYQRRLDPAKDARPAVYELSVGHLDRCSVQEGREC